MLKSYLLKTIKDIAKMAKVSSGTVDRVLHNRGGVSQKTELKIKKIIEESGYKPNLIARNLVLNKEYNIVVFIPSHNEASPFWEFPNKGINKAVKEISDFGAKVEVHYFDQYDVSSFEKGLDEILNIKNINGIVVAPMFAKETLKRKKQFEKLGVPYIFVNVDLKGLDNISFVGQDSFQSGYLAAKLFQRSQSVKNSDILILEVMNDIENSYVLDNRIKGFLEYFNENISFLSLDRLKISRFDKDLLDKELTKKLIANNNIKGIFTPSVRIGNVADYLDRFEIEMDTVIGYDISTKNIKYLDKGIISFLINQEPFNQGYNSVKLMFEHLVHNRVLKEKYLSPIQIVVKENLEYYL